MIADLHKGETGRILVGPSYMWEVEGNIQGTPLLIANLHKGGTGKILVQVLEYICVKAMETEGNLSHVCAEARSRHLMSDDLEGSVIMMPWSRPAAMYNKQFTIGKATVKRIDPFPTPHMW